jgi:hypothetical protein
MSFEIPHGHHPVFTFDFVDVIQNAQKITELVVSSEFEIEG